MRNFTLSEICARANHMYGVLAPEDRALISARVETRKRSCTDRMMLTCISKSNKYAPSVALLQVSIKSNEDLNVFKQQWTFSSIMACSRSDAV